MLEPKPRKFLGFLKTTALGGLLFLLPLIVLGALIGQVAPLIWSIAVFLNDILPVPVKTPAGIALLVLLALAIVLSGCFAAGLIARRSIGQRLSKAFEKNIMMLFPRYAVFKDQLHGSLGGDEGRPGLKPVVVRWEGALRVGFERDRMGDEWVTVYLPGTPDPWSGQLAWFPVREVQTLDLEFGETVGLFEQLGRGSGEVLGAALGDRIPAVGSSARGPAQPSTSQPGETSGT